MSASGRAREVLGFGLFGAATARNANVGPAATAIGDDPRVSLAAVGVLAAAVTR